MIPKKYKKIFNSLTKSLQDLFMKVFEETEDGEKALETVNTVQKMYKEHKIFGHFTKQDDTDNYIIAGIATTEALDTDDEIVDKQTVIEFIKEFFEAGAPLCNRHNKDDVVGKVMTANYLTGEELEEFCTKNNVKIPQNKTGLCVTAKVENDKIKEECDKNILSTFSVGLTGLKKVGKRLFAKIHELSVVPFPANVECNFNIAKMLKVDVETDVKDNVNEDKCEIKPEVIAQDDAPKEKQTKKPIRRIKKMNFTQEEIKILKQFGFDPATATETELELAIFKSEKAKEAEEAKIKELADKKVQETLEKMEAEKEKAEIKEMQNELIELGVEETEFAEMSKSRLAKLLKAEKERAKNKEDDDKAKENVDVILNAKDKSSDKAETINVSEMFVNSKKENVIINKGLETGVYDISMINKHDTVSNKNKLNWIKCKAFAQEFLKMSNEGTRKKYKYDEIKASFVNKALADTTASTGAYLTQETFQDFIVDEPLKEMMFLAIVDKDPMQEDDSFMVKRRTARGKAIFAGETTSFSAVNSTYETETVNLKIIRYDGAVTDFLLSTAKVDALAEEFYSAKEEAQELLETCSFWGCEAVAALVAAGGSTSTGALSFKGIHEYAQNSADSDLIVDSQGTAITTAILDTNIVAQYKTNSKLMNPQAWLVDPALEGKINNLIRSEVAINSTELDGGIKVGTINQVPLVCSFSLSSSADAPTIAVSASGTGTVDDQVFVQVAAVQKDGLTIKCTEANATPNATEALKIAITNRTDDYFYYIYIGSATGTTYFYDAVEKSSASTTDYYIIAPPTYPSYNKGRIDADDRVMIGFSDHPLKGIRLKSNKMGELRIIADDGNGSERFQLRSYVALEVKHDKALMVAFVAKA